MIFGKSKKKTVQVLVYSMGRDGSSAIFDGLSTSPELNVRHIYTLDRKKVTSMMMSDRDNIPSHIVESDKILREELARDVPFHFITMVHEPFGRHVRQAFYLLQAKIDASAVGYALANTKAMQEQFAALPVSASTDWFTSEYLPSTGINIYKDAFDPALGFKEYKLGLHKLLILSAHIPSEQQTEIISRFLDVKIAPLPEDTSPTDGLRDLFMTQVLSENADSVFATFQDTPFAKHFFSPEQLRELCGLYAETAQHVLGMQDTLDHMKSVSVRDQILHKALSQTIQVPQLTAELGTIAGKRGADGVYAMADQILKQLERAQNNLLLSALRTLAPLNVKKAVELGETWIEDKHDDRVIKALSAYLQRDSAISRPYELIKDLPSSDGKLAKEKAMLQSQYALLKGGYPFSAPAARTYTPSAKSILYNPHQCLPFHTSGYATRTHGIVKGLKESGWQVNVFARAGYPADTGVDPAGVNSKDIDGIPYNYDLEEGHGQRDLPLDAYIDNAADYIVAQARVVKPHIIHTASNFVCGLAGIEAARRLGVPSIYEMRGLWHITKWSKDPEYINTDKFALAQKMELEAAAAADRVLAITGALKEWLVDHGIDGNKVSLAPNAVDLSQFKVAEPDTAFADQVGCAGKIVVGYIGSFVQYEGLDLLIHAVAKLPASQRQQIRLLWIGDGPVLAELLELAETLGVSDTVISLGRRPFEEVPRAYSIVDISAFPRKGQAICEIVSPLKPFEAMAMQKAVIVSDVRPLKEIIDHEITGLVHRKDDSDSLSEQLSRFISDADLRRSCGRNAREWIEKTRQWDIIAASISDVYKQII